MKKLLLALVASLAFAGAAQAQVSCVGVGGVNNVPQVGVTCVQEPSVATYAATGVGIVPAASATDIACIAGSATRVIRVQSVRVSGSGTAISVPVLIKKNASADTGGTPGTGVVLPVAYALDSTNPTSTATLVSYTANPTIPDSAAGIISSANLGLVATTVGAAVTPYVLFDYAERTFSEAPTLRGVAQQICVNLNATSPTALLNVTFRWTEAPQ
jgi:hypothetical protein